MKQSVFFFFFFVFCKLNALLLHLMCNKNYKRSTFYIKFIFNFVEKEIFLHQLIFYQLTSLENIIVFFPFEHNIIMRPSKGFGGE